MDNNNIYNMTDGIVSLTRITQPDDFGFAEIKLLYQRAFPADERREIADLNHLLENPEFSFYLISHYTRPAGLLAVWHLPEFVFIEHIAISEQLRNKKIGANALQILLDSTELPVLLETELPENETGLSRLGFYKRMGFSVLSDKYIQPAYHEDKQSMQMLLMGSKAFSDEEVQKIIAEIYKQVYPHNKKD